MVMWRHNKSRKLIGYQASPERFAQASRQFPPEADQLKAEACRRQFATRILRGSAQDSLPARSRRGRGLEADLTRLVKADESGSTPIRPHADGAEIGPSGDFCTRGVQKSGAKRPSQARGRQNAFTLMELFVAIAIMGLIALVVLSTLRGGLRLGERLKAGSNQQVEVILALEAMEKRIRNACPFASIGFSGSESHFSFPSLLTIAGQTNATVVALCQVAYDYNSISNSLTKKLVSMHPGLSAHGSSHGSAPVELARLDELKFSYCYWNARTQRYEWKNSWLAQEGIPLGVKLSISMRNGDRKTSLERTIWIPVAH